LNIQSNDSLRELAEIAELLRQAVEESKRRDVENAELKARIEKLEKNKTDSSAENVRRDDEIAELKAELVKLRDGDEKSKQPTKDISEVDNVPISITDQCNKGSQRDQATFPPSCLKDQKSSEDKKSVSNGIRQRNKEKKLLHESKSSDIKEWYPTNYLFKRITLIININRNLNPNHV
jgi:hypothetical protein